MTINQLIKRLEKLRDEHGKTIQVCADVGRLTKSVNDAWSVIDINEAEIDTIEVVDDDGFAIFNRDNAQRIKRCIVLR